MALVIVCVLVALADLAAEQIQGAERLCTFKASDQEGYFGELEHCYHYQSKHSVNAHTLKKNEVENYADVLNCFLSIKDVTREDKSYNAEIIHKLINAFRYSNPEIRYQFEDALNSCVKDENAARAIVSCQFNAAHKVIYNCTETAA